MTRDRWLATFLAVVIGGVSALLAVWAVWLIVDPHEPIHWEVAIPALLVAVLGGIAAAWLARRAR